MQHRGTVLNIVHDKKKTREERQVLRASEQKKRE